MIAWCFQTVGILLGAHWAYAVLGWGGYWGWDPVENASLLPWLTGTAFLHSVMMQEKRGMMKVWNVWLVFITFLLCILGTFLTRSGVVSSVHAFAQSSIGSWFVGFLVLIIAVCFGAYLKNRDYLKSENQLDSIVSRESSFLFNNLILLVSCVAILSETLFPVFSEWITGDRISVGAPFFNKVNIPIGLLLLFLTGVGPLLAWRKTSKESLKRNFGWPLAIGLAGAAFNRDLQKDMRQGDSMQIGPYTLVLQGFDTKPEKNYTAQRLLVEVLRDKKPIMMLYPEKRRFETTTENGTMVAIYSTLKEDLYVVYA